MNIATECPECCTPPAPTIMVSASVKSLYKYGFLEWWGQESTPKKVYRLVTLSGSVRTTTWACGGDGSQTLSSDTGMSMSGSGVPTIEGWCDESTSMATVQSDFVSGTSTTTNLNPPAVCPGSYVYSDIGYARRPDGFGAPVVISGTRIEAAPSSDTGCVSGARTLRISSLAITLSEEYMEAQFATNAVALLPAFGAFGPGVPSAAKLFSADRFTLLVERCKYKIRHPVPKVGNGKCYRVEWVKRFVPKVTFDLTSPFNANSGGASVTSVEILSRGVYRPTVTIGGTGTGAHAVAVMSASGQVASIRIVNPGAGYTTPPTVTLDGDATATAVINSDAESPGFGQITAINVTAGGDYLPTLLFSNPATGGTLAEASVTMDATGGIATVAVTEAGAFYETIALGISAPFVWAEASLFVHYGEETALCYKWAGAKPEGYDEGDPATHPESAEFEIPVPTAEGEVMFELKRYLCDCSNCP